MGVESTPAPLKGLHDKGDDISASAATGVNAWAREKVVVGTGPFFGRETLSAGKTSAENMDLSPSSRPNGTWNDRSMRVEIRAGLVNNGNTVRLAADITPAFTWPNCTHFPQSSPVRPSFSEGT
jgi:hypothetical protein